MGEEIEIKGKNLQEALDLAKKELKVDEDLIEYTIIEETNKTLYNILSPKYVIIKAKVKENVYNKVYVTDEQIQKAKSIINEFLEKFIKLSTFDMQYIITVIDNNVIKVDINMNSDDAKILIGYKGTALNALQSLVTLIVNNSLMTNIKIQIDIENYKENKKQKLIDLANSVANSVIATKKEKTLEPMDAFERKIIHLALMDTPQITTVSIGEEPKRRVVIKLK